MNRSIHPQTIGMFAVSRVVGQGGVGIVFDATHTMTSERRALKLVTTASEKRLVAEAIALSLVRHKNVVGAHSPIEHDGRVYLVTDFVDGSDLHQLMQNQNGPIRPELATHIIMEVANGLKAVHDQGIVHRDIKPANIMIDLSGEVRLLDFGLAKLNSRNELKITSDSGILGTVYYISPEQIEHASQVDSRSDLFSLGCVFFELLTGYLPFEGETSAVQIAQRLHGTSIQLPQHLSRFSSVIDRLLARRPTDRFQSTADLLKALREMREDNEPVTMCAELAKWCQTVSDNSIQTASEVSTGQIAESTNQSTERQKACIESLTNNAASVVSKSKFGRRAFLWSAASFAAVSPVVIWTYLRSVPTPPIKTTEFQAEEFLTLPGLNGMWALEEVPWLLPEVRSSIYETICATPPPSSVNLSDSQTDNVYHYISQIPRHSAVAQDLMRRCGKSSVEDLAAREFPVLIAELVAKCNLDKKEGNLNPVAVHTIANLAHLMARQKTDFVLDDEQLEFINVGESDTNSNHDPAIQRWHICLSAYKLAGTLYRDSATADVSKKMKCLHAVCALDHATFCMDMLTEFPGSNDVSIGIAASTLGDAFAVIGLRDEMTIEDAGSVELKRIALSYACLNAMIERKRRDWNQVYRWLSIAATLSQLVRSEPLRAFVDERSAWTHLDLVYEGPLAANKEFPRSHGTMAFALFDAAKEVRKQHRSRGGNRQAQALYYHDWHGKAYACRFDGKSGGSNRAYDEFSNIAIELASKLKLKGDECLPAQRLDFKNRLFNSLERRADCRIFDPSATTETAIAEVLKSISEIVEASDFPQIDGLEHLTNLSLKMYFLSSSTVASPDDSSLKEHWLLHAKQEVDAYASRTRSNSEVTRVRSVSDWRELLLEMLLLKDLKMQAGPVSVACTQLTRVLSKTFEKRPSRDECDILGLAGRVFASIDGQDGKQFEGVIRICKSISGT